MMDGRFLSQTSCQRTVALHPRQLQSGWVRVEPGNGSAVGDLFSGHSRNLAGGSIRGSGAQTARM
jgi:hypothetical protein